MRQKIVIAVIFLVLFVLALVLLANSMTRPSEHDEQMYCTAAVLTAQGKMIYRDFSYVAQMPYHPLLCAALFRLFDTTHYLLTARLLSCLCDILVVLCIVAIYRRVFGKRSVAGTIFGLAGAVLYVFNPFVDYASGFAWNHDVVVACVMLSFWIFQTADFAHKSRYRPIALAAALLTLGTFMRNTTGLVQLLFFIFLAAKPAESAKEKTKNVLTFILASIIVSIWPIFVILQAPQAFYLNIFRMPVLNGQFLHQAGMAYEKLELLRLFLKTPGCFLLILTAVYLGSALWLNHGKSKITGTGTAVLAAFLALVFFIIAFIPVTMWLQYLAVPVPFLIISFAWPLLYLMKLVNQIYFRFACALIGLCAFLAIFLNFFVLFRIPKLFSPRDWTPIQIHNVARDIASNANGHKQVLTLAPLLALEGGCSIYVEFSAGVFAYRIADYLSDDERKLTHTVGAKTLRTLLAERTASTVILGVEPKSLEQPIFETLIEPAPGSWDAKIYDEIKLYKDSFPVAYFRR